MLNLKKITKHYTKTECLPLSKKDRYYCDQECIQNQNLYDLLTKSWTQSESIESENYNSVTYVSEDLILSAVNTDELEFILIQSPDYYTIVGVFRGHPFVETNEFRFDNSDGSGPNVIYYEDFDDYELIIINLIKYFHEFTRNKYH